MKLNMKIELKRPNLKYKTTYLEGLKEFSNDHEKSMWIHLGDSASRDFPEKDFESFVDTLLVRETTPPKEFVRDTVYWAVFEEEVVGRISIRHELNDFLSKFGGHVGYIVRPSFRRQGIASEILRLALKTERAKTIGKLLVTCDENHVASEKTIIKNGGVLENIIDVGENLPPKKRFWITLS